MTKESYIRYSGHLGSILFNIGIVGLILVIGIVFSPIMWFACFAVLIILALYGSVLSAGTIWAVEPFRNFMGTSFGLLFSDEFWDSISILFENTPLIAIITGVILTLSTLFLFFDRKNRSSRTRLTTAIVLIILFIIMVVCLIIGIKVEGVNGN